MLRKCSKVLLLSNDASLIAEMLSLAKASDVALNISNDWNEHYRVNEEVIICEEDYLDLLDESYYQSVVLVLKEGSSFIPYMSKVNRFIFNKDNAQELAFALMKEEVKCMISNSLTLKEILDVSNTVSFKCGRYDFDFLKDTFKFNDKAIYLTKTEKVYLAKWLLLGDKDNEKRMLIFKLRKRLCSDFLKDVDRLGQYIGGNNE